MTDMLVKLYDLPPVPAVDGVTVRRALAPEMRMVVEWVAAQFGSGWAGECEVSFSRLPVACFIAVHDGRLAGFASYEATARGVFGPLGVAEAMRGRGIARALTLAALHDMRGQGYAYAVIGGVGEDNFAFYEKTAGATAIAGSAAETGMYRGMLPVA